MRICQYFKGLIASIKNIQVLVEHSFQNALSGYKDLKHLTWQPEDFFLLESHLQKLSSTFPEKPLSDTVNQPFLH